MAEQALDKALELARAASNESLESKALRSLSFLRWSQRRFDEAIEVNERALVIDKKLGDTEACLADLMNLCTAFRSSGQLERVLVCCKEALRLNEPLESPHHKKNFVWQMGNIYADMGEPEQAAEHYRQAIELAKKHRLFAQLPMTIETLASLFWQQGRVDESFELYRESIRTSRETKNLPSLGRALGILGDMELSLGRLEDASIHFRESAEIYRDLEDRGAEALARGKLAKRHEKAGDYQEAINVWSGVKRLHDELGDNAGAIDALEAMARVEREMGTQPALAREHLEEALALAKELGDADKESHLLNSMGVFEWGRGNFAGALEAYQEALGILRERGDSKHLGLIMNSIGVTLSKLCRHEEALIQLEEAVEVTREAGQGLLEGHAHAAKGEAYKQSGRLDQALQSYQASLEIRQSIGDRKGEGWMLHRLADIYVSQSLPDLARDSVSRASTIAREEEDPKLDKACVELEQRLPSQ